MPDDIGAAGQDGPAVDASAPSPSQVLAFLSRDPDLERLRAAFPGLDAAGLRAAFADALAGLGADGAPTVSYRKGVSARTFSRTHGLPEPGTGMHKGAIFRALLAIMKPGRLLDLGAGKGNFSLTAARLGWEVTAVDARTVRWPDPEAQEDPADAELIRGIRWVQADVREFPIGPGDYQMICILGLLHHLEVPDQVALLSRCAGTPLIVDTRIAKSNLDVVGPYEGMLIQEHGETVEERNEVATASWGNPTSFQHTEESLVRLLQDCGYARIMMMRPPHRRDYTFYLCLPPLGSARQGQQPSREARQAAASAKRAERRAARGITDGA